MVNIEKNIIKLISLVLIGHTENTNVFHKNAAVVFDARASFSAFTW